MMLIWWREITRLARSKGMPWLIAAYLGSGLLVAVGMLTVLGDSQGPVSRAGLPEAMVLAAIAAAQLVFLLLAAPVIAAEVGGHDLESGEYELLLVAGHSRFGLLVAKFGATLGWLGLLWLLYLPLYSLLPRLGTFSLHLLFKLAVVQLAPVAAAAALGLLLTGISRSRRTASIAGAGILLFALLGTYLLGGMLTYALKGQLPGEAPVNANLIRMGMAMGMPLPPGAKPQMAANANLPKATRRALLVAAISPATGLSSTLDLPDQPALMPGLPVYFLSSDLLPLTRHPLWEVQAVGYGLLMLLLLLLTYVLTAWVKRPFWRRRYRYKDRTGEAHPAQKMPAGGEVS